MTGRFAFKKTTVQRWPFLASPSRVSGRLAQGSLLYTKRQGPGEAPWSLPTPMSMFISHGTPSKADRVSKTRNEQAVLCKVACPKSSSPWFLPEVQAHRPLPVGGQFLEGTDQRPRGRYQHSPSHFLSESRHGKYEALLTAQFAP